MSRDQNSEREQLTRLERARAAVDLVATTLVALAALAVIAFVIDRWDRGIAEPPLRAAADDGTAGPPSPLEPQDMSGVPTIGSASAGIAIVEYGDFECPFCGQFARTTWPQFKNAYVDSGLVRYAFRHLPLPSHRFAQALAIGSECAAHQGRFTDMHEALFAHTGEMTNDTATVVGSRIGLDMEAFAECKSTDGPRRVAVDQASAARLGINATPTFLVGIVKDHHLSVQRTIVGFTSFETLAAVVDSLIESDPSAKPS